MMRLVDLSSRKPELFERYWWRPAALDSREVKENTRRQRGIGWVGSRGGKKVMANA